MIEPIVLWQMGRVWGLPNGSPFCMKVETWLRMAGLPYEHRMLAGPPKSTSGKIPYIERPDGTLLSDSSAIIDVLTREHGVTLGAGLTRGDRAVGTLLQRTLEEDLYFLVLYDRWVEDSGWRLTGPAYFAHMPRLIRATLLPVIRRKVIGYAHGQGVARLSAAQRADKARQDLDAIAHVLGDKPCFFAEPSVYDAIAYAFLGNVLWSPVKGPAQEVLREHATLVAFCERMKAEHWGGWTA